MGINNASHFYTMHPFVHVHYLFFFFLLIFLFLHPHLSFSSSSSFFFFILIFLVLHLLPIVYWANDTLNSWTHCNHRPSCLFISSNWIFIIPIRAQCTYSYLTTNRPFRNAPQRMPEMSPPPPFGTGKKCLALDLDETLVHSSFQVITACLPACLSACLSVCLPVCLPACIIGYYIKSHPISPMLAFLLLCILSCPISFCLILSYYILFHPFLFCPVVFYCVCRDQMVMLFLPMSMPMSVCCASI